MSVPREREPVRYERVSVVEPGDIDDLGHVNNVVYLRWVQEVAAAHWEATIAPEERVDVAWVVLRHEIDYQHPAILGDRVVARTWVGTATAARFERHTEILRASDRRLLVRARSLWCPVNARTGRPRRLDPALNERFYT
jgi:acyl-CoA thioester hydrolase